VGRGSSERERSERRERLLRLNAESRLNPRFVKGREGRARGDRSRDRASGRRRRDLNRVAERILIGSNSNLLTIIK
jgi:hypothetical protein